MGGRQEFEGKRNISNEKAKDHERPVSAYDLQNFRALTILRRGLAYGTAVKIKEFDPTQDPSVIQVQEGLTQLEDTALSELPLRKTHTAPSRETLYHLLQKDFTLLQAYGFLTLDEGIIHMDQKEPKAGIVGHYLHYALRYPQVNQSIIFDHPSYDVNQRDIPTTKYNIVKRLVLSGPKTLSEMAHDVEIDRRSMFKHLESLHKVSGVVDSMHGANYRLDAGTRTFSQRNTKEEMFYRGLYELSQLANQSQERYFTISEVLSYLEKRFHQTFTVREVRRTFSDFTREGVEGMKKTDTSIHSLNPLYETPMRELIEEVVEPSIHPTQEYVTQGHKYLDDIIGNVENSKAITKLAKKFTRERRPIEDYSTVKRKGKSSDTSQKSAVEYTDVVFIQEKQQVSEKPSLRAGKLLLQGGLISKVSGEVFYTPIGSQEFREPDTLERVKEMLAAATEYDHVVIKHVSDTEEYLLVQRDVPYEFLFGRAKNFSPAGMENWNRAFELLAPPLMELNPKEWDSLTAEMPSKLRTAFSHFSEIQEKTKRFIQEVPTHEEFLVQKGADVFDTVYARFFHDQFVIAKKRNTSLTEALFERTFLLRERHVIQTMFEAELKKAFPADPPYRTFSSTGRGKRFHTLRRPLLLDMNDLHAETLRHMQNFIKEKRIGYGVQDYTAALLERNKHLISAKDKPKWSTIEAKISDLVRRSLANTGVPAIATGESVDPEDFYNLVIVQLRARLSEKEEDK